jgi:tetratricopeptide (TPR) repeat protein
MNEDQSSTERGRLWVIVVSLALALATLALYTRACWNGFVDLDDPLYVTENPAIQSGLNSSTIAWAFKTSYASNWHPLTWISFQLDYQLFGLRPGGYHLTSVLLHTANVVLLFFVLRRMTGALWRSAAVAALFALHPLHVESVAWVAERKDVLCTLFWMLTLWAYTRYAEELRGERYLLVFIFYVLVFIFYAASLLAKPMAVTLPFVMLLLDYWPLARLRLGLGGNRTRRDACYSLPRLVVEKLPLFGLAAASSVITIYVQDISGAVRSFTHYSWHVRVMNAFAALFLYIKKILPLQVWPRCRIDLAAFYPYDRSNWSAWNALIGGLFLGGVSFLAIKHARQRPYLLVGWLWFLGSLVPVIGMVQVGDQAMADRYTYIPLVGVFLMLVWSVYDFSQTWRHQVSFLASVSAVAILLCAVLTWKQIGYWRDGPTLWEHAFEVTTNNYVAHNNRGVELLREARNLTGQARQRKLADAEWHFSQAVQIDPEYAKAQTNLATVFAQENKNEQAMRALAKSLQIDSRQEWAHYLVATLLVKQGRLDYAVEHFLRALQLNPNNAQAHNELAKTLGLQDKLEDAAAHFSAAIRIEPRVAEGYYNLGGVLRKQGKHKEAVQSYQEAVKLEPNNLEYRCEFLDTLAAAYAEAGRLKDAVATAEMALKFARGARAKQIEKLLNLYRKQLAP